MKNLFKVIKNLIIYFFSSDTLANELDMDPTEMPKDEDFVQWVAGTLVIKDSIPVAHRYGGYQFGHWVSNFKIYNDFCNMYLQINKYLVICEALV